MDENEKVEATVRYWKWQLRQSQDYWDALATETMRPIDAAQWEAELYHYLVDAFASDDWSEEELSALEGRRHLIVGDDEERE